MVLKPHFALWVLCLGILLWGMDARGQGKHRRRTTSKEETPERIVPEFNEYNHSTKLDADTYVEKVEKAANMSKKQLYFPLVLFHASWSKKSELALPEFEKGALYFQNQWNGSKLKGLERRVKFFVIACDESPKTRRECLKQVDLDSEFPVVKLFRNSRTYKFDGWFFGKTMTDWAVRMSWPVLLHVSDQSHIDNLIQHGPLFLIKASAGAELIATWGELAFENMGSLIFAIVQTNSEVDKSMPAAQTVSVRGKNLDPLPLPRRLTRRSLTEWVSATQWPIVVEMTPDVFGKLMKLRQRVVVFAYYNRSLPRSRAGRSKKKKDRSKEKEHYKEQQELGEAYEAFRAKALELRQESKLVFASLDCTLQSNSELLAQSFPVVWPPSIFVFNGYVVSLSSHMVYWEDPGLNIEDLSIKNIEAMVNNTWNKQDGSTIKFVRGWTKQVIRFATASTFAVIFVIVIPTMCCGLCCCLVRLCMNPGDAEEPANYINNGKSAGVRDNQGRLDALNADVPQSGIQDKSSRLVREMQEAVARGNYVRAGQLQTQIQKLSDQSDGVGEETAPQEELMTPDVRPSPDGNLRPRR